MSIQSLHLDEHERVLLVLHRHWFVIARELAIVLFLLLFGIAAFLSRDILYKFADQSALASFSAFLMIIYVLALLELAFAIWLNYRLDVWIITTRRVIDVEQRGLFNREISEFLVGRIQDITTEVPTIIATLLGFGTMTIHTAGEETFVVRDVPRMEEAKKIILECSQKVRQEEHAVAVL